MEALYGTFGCIRYEHNQSSPEKDRWKKIIPWLVWCSSNLHQLKISALNLSILNVAVAVGAFLSQNQKVSVRAIRTNSFCHPFFHIHSSIYFIYEWVYGCGWKIGRNRKQWKSDKWQTSFGLCFGFMFIYFLSLLSFRNVLGLVFNLSSEAWIKASFWCIIGNTHFLAYKNM